MNRRVVVSWRPCTGCGRPLTASTHVRAFRSTMCTVPAHDATTTAVSVPFTNCMWRTEPLYSSMCSGSLPAHVHSTTPSEKPSTTQVLKGATRMLEMRAGCAPPISAARTTVPWLQLAGKAPGPALHAATMGSATDVPAAAAAGDTDSLLGTESASRVDTSGIGTRR
jgi:hypothetical protein